MNIAHRISEVSKRLPQKKSVVHGTSFYTFSEFEERSNQMANYFTSLGIKKGTRTLLFVKPCLDFSVITFALFKVGAIPVLIDPGMGLKNLLSSIRQVRPHALIGIGKVHWIRRILRKNFKSVTINVCLDDVGGRTHVLSKDLPAQPKTFEIVEMSSEDPSAILFTSGGTGIPKGVIYTHGILNAQTDALQKIFNLNESEIDLPGFPLFALFTLAMGMTSVIPDMDPTKPAQCDPKKLVKNILDHQVTFVAGSPAIWERVGRYCLEKNIQLGSVKYVVMFGAPVRGHIHKMFKRILTNGDTYTPYGATECLPVSLISGSEVLTGKISKTMTGSGTCVGKAVPGVEIDIVEVSDIPEMSLKNVPGIGEIVVSGTQVTPAYFEMPEETAKAKILDHGKLWHRMGDLGWIDEDKNLWFLGRKAHRVKLSDTTLYPIQVEPIFNSHPSIRRCALVSLGESPGLVIERWDSETRLSPEFKTELTELAQKTEATRRIQDFFLKSSFPVDVRHNIKIDRLKLGAWARTKARHDKVH